MVSDGSKLKYFAYGSNMASRRLRSRVASARFLATGILIGHVLKFHKRSIDGSGKCNAYRTGKEDDQVLGVIFEIDPSEKRNLDRAEGLGSGYDEQVVTIHCADGLVDAYAYLAASNAIDDSLLPHRWYKDFVIEGAREHGLPDRYIRTLESVTAVSSLISRFSNRTGGDRKT